MRKQLCAVALSAALLAALAPSATALEKTKVLFLASGPVITAAPAGFDGDPELNPLNGQEVTVKYQKKVNGAWKTKHSETLVLESSLAFGDSSPAHFRRGKCRMKAMYAGDDTYAPSSVVKRYTCKNGMIDYTS